MVFGYDFITLDDAQKHQRRILLDRYSSVAQWSALVIPVLCLLRLCFSKATKQRGDNERPRSPSFNKHPDGQRKMWHEARRVWNRSTWWMKEEVIPNWGTRGEWLGAGAWTIWLLYLCIVDTGNDYLHLTKRFGIIGASQLPLHYILAMRSPYSPVQLATGLSHEELKIAHQILGRIVVFFFFLHGAFYMNFFVQSGFLTKRIKDADVIFGICALLLFSIISTTALEQVRRRSYRFFLQCHIAIAVLIVVPLYLHVHHIRVYVWEIAAVSLLNWVLRVVSAKIYSGTVRLLPGTDLVQVRIPLESVASALSWHPGQHVYLGQAAGNTHGNMTDKLMALYGFSNPFTVVSVPSTDMELLLVARVLNGNTKQLARLAQSRSANTFDAVLLLEGPYGASTHFPDFSFFDKILLVAGGIGATFVVPVYRSIIGTHNSEHAGHPQVRFIWAVQKLPDTQWAFSTHDATHEGPGLNLPGSNSVEIFVTRGSDSNAHIDETLGDIELAQRDPLLSVDEDSLRARKGMVVKTGRPKLTAAVDEAFSKGSRVAIIACGPRRMTKRLTASVEQWVKQGHDVYYHEESFGW